MPKQNQTIKSIMERQAVRMTSPPPERLYYPWIRQKQWTSFERLEVIVRRDDAQHYFLDTNILTSYPLPPSLWDTLTERTVVLTPGVWQELTPWRINPRVNGDLVGVLNLAKSCGDTHFWFPQPKGWNPDCGTALLYYVNLLAERKRNAKAIVDWFQLKCGRTPTTDELNQLFQAGYTDRDTMLFRKSLASIEKGKNVFTDEELVTMAMLSAVRSSVSTVILTRDADVLDQFDKLATTLSRQYQAALFAEWLSDHPQHSTRHAIPDTDVMRFYFDTQDTFLVKKPVVPDEFVAWLLPRQHRPVSVICVLLAGPPSELTSVTIPFICEAEMRTLIEAKAKSQGLNTDKLNGQNCHVTGFPRGVTNPRDFAIVGTDQYKEVPGASLRFAQLDVCHCIYHHEMTSVMPKSGGQ